MKNSRRRRIKVKNAAYGSGYEARIYVVGSMIIVPSLYSLGTIIPLFYNSDKLICKTKTGINKATIPEPIRAGEFTSIM